MAGGWIFLYEQHHTGHPNILRWGIRKRTQHLRCHGYNERILTSYTFTNNVIPCGGASCSSPNWPPPVPGRYPTGNFFPASIDPGVGFVNYPGGDYHLAASSPYKNQATDGTDPGANIDALNAMTVNAGL